jgi:lysozyme family protein
MMIGCRRCGELHHHACNINQTSSFKYCESSRGAQCLLATNGPTAPSTKRREDKMLNVALLKKTNANRWRDMRVTAGLVTVIDKTASRLADPDAKARYVAVSNKTSVPWFVIAVIHEREASQSWKANLAQGDPWNEVSIHVPKGRGPFKSWEDAAVDALANCAPHAAKWKDWTAGGTFTLLEEYNGLL